MYSRDWNSLVCNVNQFIDVDNKEILQTGQRGEDWGLGKNKDESCDDFHQNKKWKTYWEDNSDDWRGLQQVGRDEVRDAHQLICDGESDLFLWVIVWWL